MRVIGKKILLKLKKKNLGNKKLCVEIDRLLSDLENYNPSKNGIKEVRNDADCVHSDGFYFFDIAIHRTLILIEQPKKPFCTVQVQVPGTSTRFK